MREERELHHISKVYPLWTKATKSNASESHLHFQRRYRCTSFQVARDLHRKTQTNSFCMMRTFRQTRNWPRPVRSCTKGKSELTRRVIAVIVRDIWEIQITFARVVDLSPGRETLRRYLHFLCRYPHCQSTISGGLSSLVFVGFFLTESLEKGATFFLIPSYFADTGNQSSNVTHQTMTTQEILSSPLFILHSVPVSASAINITIP